MNETMQRDIYVSGMIREGPCLWFEYELSDMTSPTDPVVRGLSPEPLFLN